MKYLLDTCALLWWWSSPENLSRPAREAIQNSDNEIFVSAASAWEISTKTRIGRLAGGEGLLKTWEKRLLEDGFQELAITSGHARKAGLLPGEHRDPFDRMLAAQSLLENLPLVTCDPLLAPFGVVVFW